MNDRIPPSAELLSAYHDGELTAAERESVERLLEESAEARRALAEIAQLGGLLDESTSNRLPAEFRAQVLAATERSMLLPPPDDSNGQPAGSASGRRTAAWAGIAGLLAAAASVTIAVVLIRPTRTNDHFAARAPMAEEIADAELDGSRADKDAALAARAMPEGERLADRGPMEHADESRRFGRGPGEAGAARVAARAPGGAAAGADAFEEATADRAASPPRSFLRELPDDAVLRIPGSPLRLSRRDIAGAEIGDVIDAIDTSGEGIAVVRVTVVDREAGIGAARLLLAPQRAADARLKLQEPRAQTADAQPANAESKDARSTEAAESRDRAAAEFGQRLAANALGQAGEADLLETVIVQATPAQLSALLDELHDAVGVRDLALEPPIELAQLDGEAKRRLAAEWRSVDASHAATPSTEKSPLNDPPGDSATRSIVPAPASGTRSESDEASPERRRTLVGRRGADQADLRNESATDAADPIAPREAAPAAEPNATKPAADVPSAQPPAIAKQVSPSFSQHLLRSRDLRGRSSETIGRYRQVPAPAAQSAQGGPTTTPKESETEPAPLSRPAVAVPADVREGSAGSAKSAVASPDRSRSLAEPRRVQVLFLLVREPSSR